MPYKRKQSEILAARLHEKRRFIQVLAGPRQSGKTTVAYQVGAASKIPSRIISADDPEAHGRLWLQQQWEISRAEARDAWKEGSILIIDEIQKMPDWSESVKRFWGEDTQTRVPLKVLILESAPLLMQGLTESLAGRFDVIRSTHWSFAEMRDALDGRWISISTSGWVCPNSHLRFLSCSPRVPGLEWGGLDVSGSPNAAENAPIHYFT